MCAFVGLDVGCVNRFPYCGRGRSSCVLCKVDEDGLADWWFRCLRFKGSVWIRPYVVFGLVFRDKVGWSYMKSFGGDERVLDEVYVEGVVDGGVVVFAGLVM